jgi:hypothetical protein
VFLLSQYRISLCVSVKWADIPNVKRKSGQSLKRQERQSVVNVCYYIKAKKPNKSGSWLAAETATATGTS